MAYRALRSFTGIISMIKGEVREITDPEVAKDLVKCGYVVSLTPTSDKTEKPAKVGKKKAEKVEADHE